ncbi:hypothetical protein N7535_000961 [Penicillium sp. DV-2018c]|nr:hypothetical protein N7461_005795 [Penicillium sp. DV-2018c]KAJ5582341.1 hypothetical protein N7535_000961 [Penicillium sp. DV-2018c]
MFITDDESGEDWPTSLTDVQVGGAFVRQEMTSFRWPQNIEELALCGCENLTPEVLECIFINEQLSTTLTRLAIHGSNRHMFADRDASSLARLRNLKTLQIPIDLLYRLQLLPASDTFSPLIPIRELELTPSYDNDFTSKFVVEDLCRALRLNLSRVCSLGISLECLELIPESTFGKIDKWVWKNIDRCPEEELDSIFELGVYIIDPPALC